jgi:hypothetical protein
LLEIMSAFGADSQFRSQSLLTGVLLKYRLQD